VSGSNARTALAAIERDADRERASIEEVHSDGDHVVVVRRSDEGDRAAVHYVIRGDEVASEEPFSDPAEALRAAGLAETTGRDVLVVRRHYAAFNGDDLGAIAETLHPEVEILGSDERGGGRLELYSGREEATAFFAEIKEAVEHNDVAVLSLDARPGRVEASVRLHGTVRSTDRSGSLPAIHFFAIRDGLIARIETYRPDWRGSD
jgi:ketosteroid isomerase-like protein